MLNSKILQHPNTNSPLPRRDQPQNPVLRAPGSPVIPQSTPSVVEAEENVFRKFAFRAAIAMLFFRVAMLSETLYVVLHFNTYILYIVGPPAILGVALTGGFGRTLRHPSGWLWLGLLGCMLLSVPFSFWLGGSINDFKGYALFSFPLLFTVAGLTVSWREVRTVFTTIGAAGVVFIATSRFMANGDSGRLEITSNTSIGNSNDLASHIIFVLPFLLYIALDKRRAFTIRISMLVPAAVGFWIILGTASRGAVIAMAAAFMFVLLRASVRQRAAAIALLSIIAVSLPFLLKGNAADRLSSMFGTKTHEEAKESEDQRSYLLKQSLIYTWHHPIFGVGLGQFSNFEGAQSVGEGKLGAWHETHNCFTQVSSECGIPALICFVLAIGAAMLSVNRVYRRARKEGYVEIANAAFCYLTSMVGYMVSITFLANAFRFYLPAMIGLAIALTAVATREMAAGSQKAPLRFTGFTPRIPGTRLAPQ